MHRLYGALVLWSVSAIFNTCIMQSLLLLHHHLHHLLLLLLLLPLLRFLRNGALSSPRSINHVRFLVSSMEHESCLTSQNQRCSVPSPPLLVLTPPPTPSSSACSSKIIVAIVTVQMWRTSSGVTVTPSVTVGSTAGTVTGGSAL